MGNPTYVERQQRPPAHGVHVAQGVGRGYLAVRVGVVNYWRKEVERLDDRRVVVELVHGGVVSGGDADQQVWVGDRGQLAQNLGQVRRTEL